MGFLAARQRLFEQRHVLFDEAGNERIELARRESLIAVDAQPDLGPRGADRRHARQVECQVARQLDLDRARLRVALRGGGHRWRRIGAQCEGGAQRPWRRLAGQLPDRHAGARRFQLPQRAVDGIARAARWQDRAQCVARRAGGDRGTGALELRQHVRHVVAQVVHAAAFAAPAVAAIAQRHDDDVERVEQVARDAKRRGQTQLLDGDRYGEAGHQ